MRNQQFLRLLERGNRLLSTDGGKVVEELCQRVPAFQIIDQGLQGYPSSDENGSSAENLRIGVNDALGHDEQCTGNYRTDRRRGALGAMNCGVKR